MEPKQDDVADRGKLVQLACGHMAAQAVAAGVRLGLVDLIGDSQRRAADLARECGADPQATTRLLRALAALELLVENRPGSFSLTPAGALLRTDRPDSLHSLVRMVTCPATMRSWDGLADSVRTGKTSFDAVFGTDFFSYLKENPELSAEFNAAMGQGTHATIADILSHYDFGGFATVVDVGGGDGTLLAAILRKHSSLRGILFDTPEGLGRAGESLGREGVEDRCALDAGDFFDSVPDGGDLYLLKNVVHDWDDGRATVILRNCRRAVPESGRVLLVEVVLPATVASSTGPINYLSDLDMLVNLGGRERTRADFEDLCRLAGLTLTRILPLPPPSPFSLIEAAPAG
ncbi:methyltransferase [Saccharopolyspora phatthalungensis]|uniref:Methyltransferase n=1 Tax=Saccharopolyspora phatthalungensis TaxID=664693 RepID=A0A840PZE4_9PSEU|nr:methyltransferase [Saccharopolyspora phatthalungensis]MBB5153127.1 hypothetical protein [Saccharopolyspora phatthalungensis]